MSASTRARAALTALCTGAICGLASTASAQVVAGVDEENLPAAVYNLNTGLWSNVFQPDDPGNSIGTGGSSFDGVEAMACDDVNELLYWSSGSNLYVVDLNTFNASGLAQSTFVADITTSGGSSQTIDGLAFANGVLYASDASGTSTSTSPEGIYSVDTVTGVTTMVLDLSGVGTIDIQGLSFNPLDNLFYGTDDSGSEMLVSIDVFGTGAVTDIVAFPATTGGTTDVDGLAVGVVNGEAKAFFIHDESGEYGVYNITTGLVEAPIPANPAVTVDETFSGGAWCPSLIPAPVDGDLTVSISAGSSQVLVGDTLTYNVTVANAGNTTLNNVTVDTTLDPGTTFLFSPVGSAMAGVHTATFTTLAPLSNEMYTIDVSVDADGTLIASTTATADEVDPDPANNTDDASVISVAPPPNDDCFNATLVTSFPFADTQDNSLATADGPPAAVTGCNSSSATTIQNSIWYNVNVATAQVITVTITEIDSYDMVAAVWEGTCGTIADPPITCDDTPEPIVLEFVAQPGQDYLIAAGDWGTGAGGGLTDILIEAAPVVNGACCFLDGTCADVDEIQCTNQGGTFQGAGTDCGTANCPVILANDNCSNAILVNSFPFTDQPDTSLAGADAPAAAVTGCNSTTATTMQNSVWYEVQVGVESVVTVTTTEIDSYDMVVGVWEGSCGTLIDPPLACDDEPEPVVMQFVAQQGLSYFVKLGDWGTGAGGGLTDVLIEASPAVSGACCFENGTCSDLNEIDCTAQGGTFQGGGTDCATFSCPDLTGACCFNVGTCIDATPSDCDAQGGIHQGAGTNCGTFSCPDFSPVNDLCSAATLVDTFPFTDTRDTSLATPDAPAAAISGCNSTTATTMQNSIWYEINSASEQLITVTITEIDSYDVVAGVWQGDCLTIADPPIVCDDSPEPIVMQFVAQPGVSYLLQSGDWGTSAGGGLTDILIEAAPVVSAACCFPDGTCTTSNAIDCAAAGGTYQGDGTDCGTANCPNIFPSNDLCADATVVDLTTPFSDTKDTALAGNEGDPAGSCDPFSATTTDNSIWYTFTPCASGTVDIVVDPDAGGDVYDGIVTIYTGACGALTEVACFDDPEPITITGFAVTGGTTYLMSIGDTGASDGGGITDVSITSAIVCCPCELDGNDAQVDVFDLLAYLDLWFAGAPGADIDGTPGVDVFDLLAFLDCWFPASAGNPCP